VSDGRAERQFSETTLGAIAGLGGVCAWLAAVIPALSDLSGGGPVAVPWLGLSVAYLVVFLLNMRDWSPARARGLALLLVALYVVLLLVAPGYGTNGMFTVMAIACVAFCFSDRVTAAVALGQALALAAALAVSQPGGSLLGPLSWGGAYLGIQLFAVAMVAATRREREARMELAAAQAALAEASRAEERLRMARDLHDQVGHQLTALALHLEAATHLAAGGPAAEPVERCRALAKDTLADVRAVVAGWRGDGTAYDGAAYDGAALAARLDDLAAAVPQPRVVVGVSDLPTLTPAAYDALVRAAQEVVTNAARHAGATELRLDVRAEDGEIVLRGVDDGRGAAEVVAGNGLTGMRERFARLGGLVTASGTPGGGFRVVARLPERS